MLGNQVEATDNRGNGIAVSSRANLRDIVATGNGGYGILAGPALRLYRCQMTDNDGAPGGVDVASVKRPSVGRTTCDRSVNAKAPAQSYGVCANDP